MSDESEPLEIKLMLLNPLIDELKRIGYPYPQDKAGELQRKLSFLDVKHPIDKKSWPKYLKKLSMEDKYEQAKRIPDYLDATPD